MRKYNKDNKRAYDTRYKQEVAAKDNAKRLHIGPLTFVEHNDSILDRYETVGLEPIYAFLGGLKLTEPEIRGRVK